MSEKIDKQATLDGLSLGKVTEYIEIYTPTLLQAVPRSMNRAELNLTSELPFYGTDRWNGYELSWLNSKGKPQVAIMRCEVPASSPNLVESKSFKLYLNSFNQSHFDSIESVTEALTTDLSQCAGEKVKVKLFKPTEFSQMLISQLDGESIDELDIEVENYQLDTTHLIASGQQVEETLTSDLLKSNCLITNQPDWGSVLIRYQGQKINHEGLLRYLISFRQHNEFHEQCVERIFCDIMANCKPNKLSVYARYTRRGGLDINPFRSNFEQIYSEVRLARQ
ncbi:NADPH-dependent 7-cyano-7-deazaguanine reductase QueF [uncultured Paraglaciecola sp.]|uniref:NADPH-dependent 7-cyano-7-deazaguanine reductase QueF n=1 Tax=uncultured Paraglaciecola sp. TaxID=1765024 RepID=UPI0025DD2ECB|nr:NADPH-dependent 7-cyano-7-deazaguanine reductase QueF [uncultured Paraglaciecola sp.]